MQMKYGWMAEKLHCEINRCRFSKHLCRQGCQKFAGDFDYLNDYKVLFSASILIGIMAIFGNVAVIVVTVNEYRKKRAVYSSEEKITKIYFVSLSFSDMIVAISVIVTSATLMHLAMEKHIPLNDLGNWRVPCDVVSSILIIGSEQSVFTLFLITFSRVNGIFRPFSRVPMNYSVIALLVSWILSILVGIIPLISYFEDIFLLYITQTEKPLLNLIHHRQVDEIITSLQSFHKGVVNSRPSGKWATLRYYMNDVLNVSSSIPFGYYHGHALCMPNFYPATEAKSKPFTVAIFVLNASLFALMVVGYLSIYVNWKQSASQTRMTTPADEESRRLRKRILLILATDCACWIPLSTIGITSAFIETDLLDNDILSIITVTLVLQINSVVNPFIYSAAPEYLHQKFAGFWRRKTTRSTSVSNDVVMTTIDRHDGRMASDQTCPQDARSASRRTFIES